MICFGEIIDAANQANLYGAILFEGGAPASEFRIEEDGSITVVMGSPFHRPTWSNEILDSRFQDDALVYAKIDKFRQPVERVYADNTDVILVCE